MSSVGHIITPDTTLRNLFAFARPYMENPEYTDIAVNRPGEILCYDGAWHTFKVSVTEIELEALAQALATRTFEQINRGKPILTVMMSAGSRVHITQPPVTRNHTLTIRQPSHKVFTRDQYLSGGMFSIPGIGSVDQRLNDLYAEAMGPKATPQMRLQFCWEAVAAGKTTVVAGAAGSGKTALLNMLVGAIDHDARLIVCEDAQEIRYPDHANSVGMRFASSGKVGDLSVTPTEVLKSSLRMFPTRIIFGELRDGDKATQEWLSACSSGHSGSLTTVHAGSVQECYSRLIKMSRQSDDPLPYEAAKEDVMLAVDLVIHIGKVDGQRIVTEIAYTP